MLLDICRVIRLERMSCARVPLQASEIMSLCVFIISLYVPVDAVRRTYTTDLES